MSERLQLAISPCPNDTFAFHGLLSRAVDSQGFEFELELHEVQELNRRLALGEFDAAKASCFAALELSEECAFLASGAALGFGVGPLLLARKALTHAKRAPISPRSRVLCPGQRTTAHLLFRLFHPGEGAIEQVRFSEILPSLESGAADFGVCIHEGRFTWEGRGLSLVEDLGERWEAATGLPLPLGGVVARKRLGRERGERLTRAIQASIDYGFAHRDEALTTMRAHAQEQADDVLWKHVELYVNEESRALSALGRRSIAELGRMAHASELLAPEQPALEIWGGA